MDRFVITGGNRLCGRLTVKGSKNAALPIMAAALLTDRPVLLRDVANLADIRNMIKLLGELGCKTEYAPSSDPKAAGGTLLLHAEDESQSHARYEIVKTMRASICALGPMLARRGYARVSMPGGCAIGDRPVDLHLRGLEALGADIQLHQGKGGLQAVLDTDTGHGIQCRLKQVLLQGDHEFVFPCCWVR